MSGKAIGVFDSGIGGLTVLKELLYAFPDESFIYLGDTARLPYGSKSAQTIRKYSEQNMQFLVSQGVKALVIACNSASANFLENSFLGIPVFNVIEPGARLAAAKSQNQKVGVLGTRATIESGAYTRELEKNQPGIKVFGVACPLFVPLAEEGWDGDPVTNLIVYRYVSQLLPQGIDTLILGCTHYPLLKNSIARAAGSSIELVDSGEAVAEVLKEGFVQGRLRREEPGQARSLIIHTTDASSHFEKLAAKILKPFEWDEFSVVSL